MTSASTEGCYACGQHQRPPSTLPSRERVFDDGLWRVAHAFSSSLPGWLVVVARRHVTAMAQLTPAEAAALGRLLVATARVVERTRAARKAYLLFLAEGTGFEHLHVHVVPRSETLPADRRGPAVLHYLRQPPDQWVIPAEMDRIADELRPLLAQELKALHG